MQAQLREVLMNASDLWHSDSELNDGLFFNLTCVLILIPICMLPSLARIGRMSLTILLCSCWLIGHGLLIWPVRRQLPPSWHCIHDPRFRPRLPHLPCRMG